MKRPASWKSRIFVVFLGGAVLQLAVTACLWFYGRQTADAIFDHNHNVCRLLVDQIMLTEHWERLETDEFEPLVQDLTRQLSKHEYKSRILPVGPSVIYQQSKSPLDAQLLERFAKPPVTSKNDELQNVRYYERLVDDGNRYEYYQPIYADKTCLICHSNLASGNSVPLGAPLSEHSDDQASLLGEGDLMAVVQITISNQPVQTALVGNQTIFMFLLIVSAVVTTVVMGAVLLALRPIATSVNSDI